MWSDAAAEHPVLPDINSAPRQFYPGMGEAVAARTILRKRADGSLETWDDVAYRVAVGNSALATDPSHAAVEFSDLYSHLRSGTILMSGRHLQHGDETQPRRNLEVFTNCSTAATSFMLFYLLMNGSGVGRSYDDSLMLVDWDNAPTVRCVLSHEHPDFDWSAHESTRDALHKYGPASKRVMWFKVPDSREGWAQALELLETLAFEKIHVGKMLILDFSDVRGKGAPIHGMQGRPASGPVPLMNAFIKAAALKGAGLERWRQAMYVDHYFGECVLVGGARRAARMSMKFWKDKSIIDFIHVKRPVEFDGLSLEAVIELRKTEDPARIPFLWSSNNSVGVDAEFWSLLDLKRTDKGYDTPSAVWARLVWRALTKCAYGDGTGEPGVVNVDLIDGDTSGIEKLNGDPWLGSEKYQVLEDTAVYLSRLAKRARALKYQFITNPCLTGDTLIAVADGRNAVSIRQLAEEGRDVPVYSTNPSDGQVQIKTGRNPRKTGYKKEIWKLTLDDGSILRATPNHEVLMKDLSYRRLQDLIPGDAIHPFNSFNSNGYRQVCGVGERMMRGARRNRRQYRLIFEHYHPDVSVDPKSTHIHHIDLDSKNDNIENLQMMPVEEHKKLHAKRMMGHRNPYHSFTTEEKKRFASHPGSRNGRWIDVSNEELIMEGKKLFERYGYINTHIWKRHAKKNGLPQTLDNTARFTTFQNFVNQVADNHKVVSVEPDGVEDVYNITVDDNHNYYVITSAEDARYIVSSGICVKNCGEIRIHLLGGFCIIADVVPYHAASLEDAESAFRAATRALIRVNTMKSVYDREVKRTNRIGVGITGIHEFAWRFFEVGFRDLIDPDFESLERLESDDSWYDATGNRDPRVRAAMFWKTLERFRHTVEDEAERYSKALGLVTPHTSLTIKPAGTTSKLFGLTEGWHLPPMAFYLRWVQFREGDPLVERYRASGYPVRSLVTYKNTVIVGFPTAPAISTLGMGDKLVCAGDATPEEQYEWLRLGEKYWLGPDHGNQISYTLHYDPKRVDFKAFKRALLDNQRSVRACSVMPREENVSHEYTPEEMITKAKYEELSFAISQTLNEDVDRAHVDCSTGACPIHFDKEEVEAA